MNAIEKTPPRIIVVDDERPVRELLSRWLRSANFECAVADGAAALRSELTRQPFDLVTLDISMPNTSGLVLLDEIKQHSPDISVLMVTGDGDTSKAVHALTRGAFGYLCKPVHREELIAQVKIGLERHRLTVENREYLCGLEKLVREQTRVIRQAHEETIHCLINASMYRDEETGAHVRRTGLYSELLAASTGWSQESCDTIRLAAPMHDIGKIGIPDAILRKPAKLTAEEYTVMQQHATLGAEMLGNASSPFLKMAREIAQSHHERWDGTGYPAGLRGEEIPESARIVAIVDVFDALTHDRVYRPAFEPEQVLNMMRSGRGSHFDPRLLDIFMSLLPEMNAIAQAVVDDGECGGVTTSTPGWIDRSPVVQSDFAGTACRP